MINKITFKIALLLMLIIGQQASAQDVFRLVNGTVTDEFNKPLSDVIITCESMKSSVHTNSLGLFQVTVNEAANILLFSLVGYDNQTISINSDKSEIEISVTMTKDVHNLTERVYMGHSEYDRMSVSGSVSTVTGKELQKSPTANLSLAMIGRLPGLYTHEVYSEASRSNVNMFIRGANTVRNIQPTVIIDGIVSSFKTNEILDYISAAEIESITILKDAASQALYGIQGGSGIIAVKTKRGHIGDLRINVRADISVQETTTKPFFVNSALYATMRNDAGVNDGKLKNYYFTDEQIAKYDSGEDRNLHPNNNWYNKYFRKAAFMQRVGVDIGGGNDKVRYFTNVNFMHQGGQFRTDQKAYEGNPNNTWFNFRSNIDIHLNKYLTGHLNLSGNIKRERIPGGGFSGELYASLFELPSTTYGPTTPLNYDENTGSLLEQSNQVVTTDKVDNPIYGRLNRSGYLNHTVTNINAQFGLNLDMSFLLEGLNIRGDIAYQTNSVNSLSTLQNFERWMKTSNTNELSFIKKGSNQNTPLSYGKSSSFYYHLTYKGSLDYKRNFDKHHVSGIAYMFYQNLVKNDTGSPWNLPYDRLNLGAEVAYDYDHRYLLRLDVGYSGSEQYARSHRYLTTPGASAAWILSNESFFKDQPYLSFAKLRASIGKTGNDQSGLNRFAYLDEVVLTGVQNIPSYLEYTIDERQLGNPKIKAEAIKKQNYGIDLGFFNQISVSFDYFIEKTSDMVVRAVNVIPEYQGVPLSRYPSTNTGTFENKGYEIEVNYSKNINKEMSFAVGGFFSDAENKQINTYEAIKDKAYVYRQWNDGFPLGQQFGYLVDYSNGNGFFNFQNEIDKSSLKYAIGDPRVGDLKYQDLNGDGEISEEDMVPLGTGRLPRQYYGFSGSFSYKDLELSFLFQGVGKWDEILGGRGIYEHDLDGIYGSLHSNAWTVERFANGDKITYPALSTAQSVNHQPSDFFLYDRSYLRLKNVELSYSLPRKISNAIGAEQVLLRLSGQNLITWDKMKSSDFGPEGTFSSIPVYRVYNLGISFQF